MNNFEKLQYAKSRLGLARMMGDQPEVEKWQEHVAYWEAAQQNVQRTAVESSSQSSNSVMSVGPAGFMAGPRRR